SWVTTIRIDQSKVEQPRITREVFRGGERLSTEPIRPEPAEAAKGQVARIEVQLRSAATTGLKPGAYAQRIVVEAHWMNRETREVLHIERWYYFSARNDELVRLSPEEYERLSDPPRDAATPAASNGSYVGGDRVAEVPLSRTDHSQAVRADSAPVVPEERPPLSYAPGQQIQQTDRSEANEP